MVSYEIFSIIYQEFKSTLKMAQQKKKKKKIFTVEEDWGVASYWTSTELHSKSWTADTWVAFW